VLFLHGAGERGQDGLSPTYVGLGAVLRHSPQLYPAVVVFPQCETWDDPIFSSWSYASPAGRRALAILEEVEKTESIDTTHRSLTGWSMGGFGAASLAAHDPAFWQSVLCVSGGHAGESTETLAQARLWIIHGTNDSIVSVKESQRVAAELLKQRGNSHYDEIPTAGHEVWEQVYSDPRVAQWLLTGGTVPAIDWSIPVDPARLPTAKDGAPFIAAATISQAVTLRIGNDALRMISAGLPESVPADRLQDSLPDIQQSLTVDGETYHLALNQLTYVAQLQSAEIATLPTADIEAKLGLKVEIRVGAASLKTRGFEASTAPFKIVIGHQRPVTLSVLIKPQLRDQKLTLTLKETAFPIPDDNWYVEIPKDIQLTGNKFTRHEIETGIVGGLYTRKKEVEEQFRSVIPPLLDRVEQRLDVSDSSQFTRWLWPFPVYQPWLRWTAEALAVDAQGMTIQLGAIVGSSNESGTRKPVLHRSGTSRLPVESRNSANLHVTIDPLLLDVISEEFAASGVARINVLDLPETRFHSLANPERMRKVLPGLAPGVEIQTVLALSTPFQLRGESKAGELGGLSHLTIPQAQLEIFSRSGSSSPWGRAGQFTLALDQEIQISMEQQTTGPPLLGTHWSDDPDFKLTTSTSIDPLELSQLERDMREAWVSWSQSRNIAPAPAKDFVLGDSRLRLDSLKLGPHSIDVDLMGPMACLIVSGNTPLRYRVRGWNTSWSLTRTLNPGQTHRYEASDPLEWQIIGIRGETYSLNPGEIARWNQESGITYEPPRPTNDPPAPTLGAN